MLLAPRSYCCSAQVKTLREACCLAAGVADYIFQSRKKGETPILFSSLTYVKKLAELWMDLNFIINLEYVCFSPANKKQCVINFLSTHQNKQTTKKNDLENHLA